MYNHTIFFIMRTRKLCLYMSSICLLNYLSRYYQHRYFNMEYYTVLENPLTYVHDCTYIYTYSPDFTRGRESLSEPLSKYGKAHIDKYITGGGGGS